MRPSPTLIATAAELARALPVAGEGRVARARAEAAARPIAYPLGSGQAEEVALLAGLKPAIRQRLDAADQARARERFARLGMTIIEDVQHWGMASISAEGEQRYVRGRVAIIGRDPERVRAIAACERRLFETFDARRGHEDHDLVIATVREEGRLLGYPRCCVDAFVGVPYDQGNPFLYAAALSRTGGAPRPRLNVLDLDIFHYVPWIPCSFDCELSTRYADAVAARIASRHAAFASRIDEALAAHRLLALEDVQVSLAGRWDGRRVFVERAWPAARDRHPGAQLAADALEAVARLTAMIEAAGSVSVEDDVVIVGEEAVAAFPRPVIVPFGAA